MGIRFARGTTPTIVMNLPFSTSEVELVKIYVTFRQFGGIVLEKSKEDCTILETSIAVALTQEDTLRFSNASNAATCQVRMLSVDGVSMSSVIMSCEILPLIKEGAI